MSVQIPYYDSDHRLITMLSQAKAERYFAQGTATAIRANDGAIRRLYRRTTERVFGSISAAVGAMHEAANQTTRRLRYGDEDFVAPHLIREHRKPDPGWPGARPHDGDKQR
jgi:hypothetical protein